MLLWIKHHRDSIMVLFFFSVIACALLAPITSDIYFPNVTDFNDHIAAIVQAKFALMEGQFPLRVAPWQHQGWRYAFYQFYSPLPYTLSGLFYRYITPNSPFFALKLTIGMMIVFAGFYSYRFSNALFHSRCAALLSGVAYVTTPYLISNIVTRGDFTEVFAQALLPWLLYMNLRCYRDEHSRSYFVFSAVSWFALIVSHLLTFIYSSLFIGLFFIFITPWHRTALQNLLRVGLAYAMGCTLALWFLAPVVLTPLSILHFLKSPIENNWLTPLSSLFSFNALTPQAFVHPALTIPLHPSIGWPLWIAAGIVVYVFFTQPIIDKEMKPIIRAAFFLFLFAMFLVWSPFNFWIFLPKFLTITQYSYRLLTQAMWTGCLLFSWALLWLFDGKLSAKHVVIGFLLLIFSSSSWLRSQDTAPLSIAEVVARPSLMLAKNAYLSDPPQQSLIVDQLPLNSLIDESHHLKFNEMITVPSILISDTSTPHVFLKGEMPLGAKKQMLSLWINKKIMATRFIGASEFEWDVPFSLSSNDKKMAMQIQFVSPDKSSIIVHEIALTHLQSQTRVLPLREVQPHCTQEGVVTACSMTQMSSNRFIELPVLYYARMLRITNNGHVVAYQPILHDDKILTAVSAQAGINQIRIEFRGLVWANWLSLFAWLGLFCLLFFTKKK